MRNLLLTNTLTAEVNWIQLQQIELLLGLHVITSRQTNFCC